MYLNILPDGQHQSPRSGHTAGIQQGGSDGQGSSECLHKRMKILVLQKQTYPQDTQRVPDINILLL